MAIEKFSPIFVPSLSRHFFLYLFPGLLFIPFSIQSAASNSNNINKSLKHMKPQRLRRCHQFGLKLKTRYDLWHVLQTIFNYYYFGFVSRSDVACVSFVHLLNCFTMTPSIQSQTAFLSLTFFQLFCSCILYQVESYLDS